MYFIYLIASGPANHDSTACYLKFCLWELIWLVSPVLQGVGRARALWLGFGRASLAPAHPQSWG